MTPSVSVIIPTYNRAAELARALDALMAQTWKDFEVLVCDDGSEEDISAVTARYAGKLDLTYLRIERSGGPARPRNVAMRQARGEWLAYLDSDDWWNPSRMEAVSAHLADPSIDVIYHPLAIVSAAGPLEGKNKLVVKPMSSNPLRQMIVKGNPIPNSAALVRRAAMEHAGYFNEEPALVSLEDFDRWITLARIGSQFKYVDAVLGSYWIGNDNISTVTESMIPRREELFRMQLLVLPEHLGGLAVSHFSYELGSIALRLRKPSLAWNYFRKINPLQAPLVWAKSLVKMAAYRPAC